MYRSSCDVLVVGGGPAGLAAAIALKMRGADVLVAEALKPPIEKACGEGLMPDSRRDLAALGVELSAHEGAPFTGICFANWDGRRTTSVSADFAFGEGLGVRRPLLHGRLVDRALELGVRIEWSTRVSLGDEVTLNGNRCSYRYLIGADGQSSRVRSWAGLDRGRLIARRFGFRRHFRVSPWSRFVEVHWGAMGQAYITPVAQDEICVSVMTRHSGVRMRQVIESIPFLRDRLQDGQASSRERGALTTTRRLKRVVKGSVALLGDAAGSADAITGEGLAMSFRQAALLGRAVEHDDLEAYASGHQDILRLPQWMARGLLLMDAHPGLRNQAMQMLAATPGIFRGMLDVHLGEESPLRFLLSHGTQIGLRLAFSSAGGI